MAYKIEEIEGIGPTFGAKLNQAGIKSTDDFLNICCDPKGRKKVSDETEITSKLILKWANLADLMRINGIGPQFSELLEASGVDTVKELRHRNAENLTAKMAEVNAEKNLAKTSPAAGVVADWIEKSKNTEPKITF